MKHETSSTNSTATAFEKAVVDILVPSTVLSQLTNPIFELALKHALARMQRLRSLETIVTRSNALDDQAIEEAVRGLRAISVRPEDPVEHGSFYESGGRLIQVKTPFPDRPPMDAAVEDFWNRRNLSPKARNDMLTEMIRSRLSPETEPAKPSEAAATATAPGATEAKPQSGTPTECGPTLRVLIVPAVPQQKHQSPQSRQSIRAQLRRQPDYTRKAFADFASVTVDQLKHWWGRRRMHADGQEVDDKIRDAARRWLGGGALTFPLL